MSLAPTPGVAADYDAAVEYLLGRINYERSPTPPYAERFLKLDRMRRLLARIGNPDAGMPIVHVAGTKGKGSTSAMIAAMLQSAGLDVGVFSSPHLEQITERFVVNGLPCPADELASLVTRIKPVATQMDAEGAGEKGLGSPTFFEIVTALALMHFSQREVDAAVLEVGLGGRLDSTNVCQPTVCVITSISFDHVKQLGSTLAEIAAEKAGIIKPGVPTIIGKLPAEARSVVIDIAQQRGSRIIEAGRDFDCTYHLTPGSEEVLPIGAIDFDLTDSSTVDLQGLRLKMLGRCQAENAAVAIATVLELKRRHWLISTEAIRQGLASATLPGRFEVIGSRPWAVLDVAHNVASAEALVETLSVYFPDRPRTVLFAGTKDKDLPGIVGALAPHFNRVIVTQHTEATRAAATQRMVRLWRKEMARVVQSSTRHKVASTVLSCKHAAEAWRLAYETAEPDGVICVTGSFFLAAQLRRQMLYECRARGVH